jgi:hypothetical protein
MYPAAAGAIGRPESGKDSMFQLSGYPRSRCFGFVPGWFAKTLTLLL